ncbi:MAG: LysR family transcriptional regulator, partial [Proteobacteria bacterium]|nr:LysR family transcriptional regulator [Pseudomonadota bacterium]
AAAARRLGMSPPAVTRAVANLEDRLGVKLLVRTTRSVRMTSVGLRYLNDIRRVLADAEAADKAASGLNTQPLGRITVTAPVLFGRMYVMPSIVAYLRSYPATDVEALFLDRTVNLIEEGVDVGIRIGDLADSSMQARRVGVVREVVCASPAYLRQAGAPHEPADLQNHTIISSTAGDRALNWRFFGSQKSGRAQTLNLNPRLRVSTNDAAIAAALAGFGVTRLRSYQIAPHVLAGDLVVLLEAHEPAPRPVNIIHREGRKAAPGVRAFIDLAAANLEQALQHG